MQWVCFSHNIFWTSVFLDLQYRCARKQMQQIQHTYCMRACANVQMAVLAYYSTWFWVKGQILAFECAFKSVKVSVCIYLHVILCVYLPSSLLTSVHGCELMSLSRTAWSVIKYLCPAAWSGKAHLESESCCQLPSPSPPLPPAHRAGIV